MPPKGKKTPTNRSKSPKKDGDAKPEVSYFAVDINEDWKSMIAFIVPSNPGDELYIEQLEKSVKNGSRRRFTWLSKKDLIDMINENASIKTKTPAVKPKQTSGPQVPISPQMLSVIESAKQFVENKEEIPDQMLAQLIKGKLMMIKVVEMEKNNKRQARLRQKNEVAVAGNATAKAKSPTGKKSPTKAPPAVKKPSGPGAADNLKQTNLKKKEEEDDEKYLDDEPKDGPDHYVILSGFYSPGLFNFIDEYRMPVDCIIKFKSPNQDLIMQFLSEIENREKLETNLKTSLKISKFKKTTVQFEVDVEDKTLVNPEGISKEKQIYMTKVKADLELFWKDINQIIEKIDDRKLIQNVARLKFNVKKDPEIKSWFETEIRAEFSENLYNDLVEKIYTLVIQKRQYKFYIENLKLYTIPTSAPLFTFSTNISSSSTVAPTAAGTIAALSQTSRVDKSTTYTQGSQRGADIDQNGSIVTSIDHKSVADPSIVYDIRYYNELVDSLPAEYISPAIILHCMVEQVVATAECKSLPSETIVDESVPQIANFSTDICKHLSTMVNGLGLDEKEVKTLSNMLPRQSKKDEPKKKISSNTPFLINYNDEIGNRLKGVLEDNSQKKVKKPQSLPFDPADVETEMLKKSMFTVFTGLPYVSPKVSKEKAARLQELLHFCSSPETSNADVDRAFKLFVFETMNLTDTNRRNTIRKNDRNLVIPWDDPYPNINAILSEDQQIFLKNLNLMEAKKELKDELKKAKENRASSASTSKSIKFNDNDTKDSLSSIMKSRPSTRMSVQSVHFPDTFDNHNHDQIDPAVPTKTIDQTIELIYNTKRRDLNDWNIAEHYEPRLLVQTLSKANQTHPYTDTYYNRRDNSLMLVLSNPYDENALVNNEEFSVKLHSDVGFRNYLEKIYDMIIDWTRDEEAKYQASLVAKDVEHYRSESVEKQEAAAAAAANATIVSSPRSKSSKKASTEVTAKTQAASETQETQPANYITDSFVGHNSLKAWKMEQENKQNEIDQAERAKKVKSAEKKVVGGKDSKMAGGRPRSSSRSPPKSPTGGTNKSAATNKKPSTSRLGSPKKTSRSSSRVKEELVKEAELKIQRANHQFVGYDVGNKMIYVKSYLNHMFPCNGGLVKTERHVMKTTGQTFVSTTLFKDGHTFTLHVIDPMTPDELQAMREEELKLLNQEVKKQEAVSQTQDMADPSKVSLNATVPSKIKSGKASAQEKINRQSKVSMIDVPSIVETMNVDRSSVRDEDDDFDNDAIARHTSFTGVFHDGMTLSFSSQKLRVTKPQKRVDLVEATPRNIEQQLASAINVEKEDAKGRKTSGINKKSGQTGKKMSTPDLNGPGSTHDIKEDPEPNYKVLPWAQLFVSTPTGLTCTFLPESYAGVSATKDNEPHRLLVKQSYTARCDEKAAEHFKNFNANVLQEKSRMIKSDGSVIKYMNDNTVQIYYPNGTIYSKQEELLQDMVAETEISDEKANLDKARKKDTLKKGASDPEEPSNVSTEPKTKARWTAITPAGNEYLINRVEKGKNEHIGYYRSIQGRDIQTGEVMLNREDHLKIIYRTDGSTLVEFEDGTRITTFYAQGDLGADMSMDTNATTGVEARREKYIKVECRGYASTIFNSKTSECTLAFGTGTLVACDPKKMLYNVIYSSGELIDINQDGYVSYMARNSMENSKNRFVFNQNCEEIFQHEDEEGNLFKTTKYGKSICQPNPSREAIRHKSLIRQYQKHSPRFFIVHKDSSGTELLRYEDICDYMADVEIDPMTAIIRDHVQGHPNVMGTTILRPLKNCLTDLWLCEYDEKDVTPLGLRCRNLLSYPPHPDIKVPGPKFGANFGRGLNFDIKQNLNRVNSPQLTIAKRMEYRQLIEYQKLTNDTRHSLMEGLKNYMRYISERAENHRLLLAHDPRSEAEKQTAVKILQLARPDNLLRSDIRAMYKSALANANLHNIGKSLHVVNKLIIKSNSSKVDCLKHEISKEKVNRQAWKDTFVPSYFESEWGKQFLEANDLGEDRRQFKEDGGFLQTSENFEAEQPMVDSNEDGRKELGEESQEVAKKIRKGYGSLPPIVQQKTFESNSMEKKENLVQSIQNFERYHPKFKYAEKMDANKLPNSIKTTRSNALPNTKFLNTEEPVRRKVTTSIVNASKVNGKHLELRRGCEIYPHKIKFGVLREAVTYACDFELFNVGIDACRFKIKQPPAETGLKVLFKPGPIAAGMSRDFTVVLLAVFRIDSEVEQINPKTRLFSYDLEIVTEADTIYMPIEAEITTSDEYRSMFRGNLEAGKEPLVRILSVNPISTRDIVTKKNFLTSLKTEPGKYRREGSNFILEH